MTKKSPKIWIQASLLLGFAAGYAASYATFQWQPKAKQQNKPSDLAAVSTSEGDPSAAPSPSANETPASQLADGNPQAAPSPTNQAKDQAVSLSSAKRDEKGTIAPEDDTPEYREKLAAELLEITQTKDMIQAAFKNSAELMGKDLPAEAKDSLQAAIQKHYSWDKMEKLFTKVYTDVFTAQEISDIADFYRSDVGTAMIKKQPEVMQKTMGLVQEINQEIQPKLAQEMEALMKKHKGNLSKTETKDPTKTQ